MLQTAEVSILPPIVESGAVFHTFQQALDLNQLSGIVKLSEVFRLLSEVLPLHGRVALVGNNVGGRIV